MHGISYKSFFICLSGFRDHKKPTIQPLHKLFSRFISRIQPTNQVSRLLSISTTWENYIFRLQKKKDRKKERKEKEKKILVRSSSNLRIPYSALIVLKELFKVSSGLKLLFSAYNLIIHKILWELERRYQQISSAMTDHNTFFSPNFCRHSSKTWKSWFKFLNFQSISICTIRSNRRQETVSMPLIYSLE